MGEPDEASIARVRASLLRTVGGAAAATAVTGAIAAAAKAAPGTIAPALSVGVALPVSAKVVVAVALVSAGVAGGYAYHARDVAPRAPSAAHVVGAPPLPRARPRPAPMAGIAAPVEVLSAEPSDTPPALPEPPSEATATSGLAPTRAAAGPARVPLGSTTTISEPPATAPSLTDDIARLREAQAALVAGDPQRALEASERMQVDGPLSEEREGVRILARCTLGVPDARRDADDFMQRRPASPLVVRIRAACGASR
jgi:hypothetical protein